MRMFDIGMASARGLRATHARTNLNTSQDHRRAISAPAHPWIAVRGATAGAQKGAPRLAPERGPGFVLRGVPLLELPISKKTAHSNTCTRGADQ